MLEEVWRRVASALKPFLQEKTGAAGSEDGRRDSRQKTSLRSATLTAAETEG